MPPHPPGSAGRSSAVRSTTVRSVLPQQIPATPSPPASATTAWPGHPVPLGAHWDGEGTNFALWTTTGTGVTLCLFDADGTETGIPLTDCTYHVWHGYLPGVGPGQRYGFR